MNNLPNFDDMKAMQDEAIAQMKKKQRIQELAEEVQEEADAINLMTFVKYKYSKMTPEQLNKVKASAIFQNLPAQGVEEIKDIVKKQAKLCPGQKMKVIDLGPSFISEPKFIEIDYSVDIDEYDLIVTGNTLDLWCLLTIYEGQWLEEYAAFNYDPKNPNLDKKYLPKDSWDQDIYLPKQLKNKIKEIMELMNKDRNPIHLPLHPAEMAWSITNKKHFQNLSDVRVAVFRFMATTTKFYKNDIATFEDRFMFFRFLYMVNLTVLAMDKRINKTPEGKLVTGKLLNTLDKYWEQEHPSGKERTWFRIFFEIRSKPVGEEI